MKPGVSYLVAGASGTVAIISAARGESWWTLLLCFGCFINLLAAWSDE